MIKIPITKPYFDEKESEYVSAALSSGWVAQGPKVSEFEKILSEHEGVSDGIATTSATTALHLSMVSMGMGEGMDVIAPAFTFVATVNSIVMTGATPILCDISKDTYNIKVEDIIRIIDSNFTLTNDKLVNNKTGNVLWGIVPVHQFGLCCDIYAINEIAKKYGLNVIEDAACSLGARINNIHPGNFGNVACVSFHPRKSITTGEGGMIFTNNKLLADKMRRLRSHGASVSADQRDKARGFLLPNFDETGYNYRMNDIQASVGLAQTEKLDIIIDYKRKAAQIYNELFSKKVPELVTPIEPDNYFHTYQSYVCMLKEDVFDNIDIACNTRNNLLNKLEEIGIATRQGTHAIHLLGYYKNRFNYSPEDFWNSFLCDKLSISLPMFYGISFEEQELVVNSIREILDVLKNIKNVNCEA